MKKEINLEDFKSISVYELLLDRFVSLFFIVSSILSLLPIIHILFGTVFLGLPVIIEEGIAFIIEPPPPPGDGLGGIGPSLVGTFLSSIISLIISIPVTIGTAVFIVEYPYSIFSRLLRMCVKALCEVPTIIVSLVVYSIIVVPLRTFSVFAGSIALFIVMLPYTVTSVSSLLENVPFTYKEAGYSIGMDRFNMVFRIMLGIIKRGLVMSFLLGLLKCMGETAPLLFTLGGSSRFSYPSSLFEPADALTLLIYDFAMSPYENWIKIAWGASCILILIYVGLYVLINKLFKEIEL